MSSTKLKVLKALIIISDIIHSIISSMLSAGMCILFASDDRGEIIKLVTYIFTIWFLPEELSIITLIISLVLAVVVFYGIIGAVMVSINLLKIVLHFCISANHKNIVWYTKLNIISSIIMFNIISLALGILIEKEVYRIKQQGVIYGQS